MKASEATNLFLDYHRTNSKKNTLINYEKLLMKFPGKISDLEAMRWIDNLHG